MHGLIRWIGGATAAAMLGTSPAAFATAPKSKTAKPNKERLARPKPREHANFKKARSCGTASRACLAKCKRMTAPAQHARCVNQGKCDSAYAKCMGKTL